jgi:hypothetical protein
MRRKSLRPSSLQHFDSREYRPGSVTESRESMPKMEEFVRETDFDDDQHGALLALRADGGLRMKVGGGILLRSQGMSPASRSTPSALRRPMRRAWVGIALCLLAAAPAAASGSKADARARAVIFGEESFGNVLQLRRETARLSPHQRFDRLLNAVFPSHSDEVRIEIDFTPTNLSPPLIAALNIEADWGSRYFEGAASRRQVGGALISPAIDLVEAAKEIGKLDELRRLVEVRVSGQPAASKFQRAMLALTAIAGEDFEAAREEIDRLRDLAVQAPVVDAERGPEAVAMWVGARHAQTREAARDLAFLVYEQARNQQGPRSERWHRQTYALKHLLQWLADHGDGGEPESTREPLSHWTRVSRMTAETCGKGFPLARWRTQPGEVSHVTCHDHDYLYFASPLAGDFAVEGDFTTFGYRDIHLGLGGVWAGPGYDRKACLNGDFRREHSSLPIDPPLTRVSDWMRVRAAVEGGMRTTFINGRKVFEAPHPKDGDPWIAIHSAWYANGSVRNLRVTGSPTIPEELDLAATSELPGWLPYFDESAGSADGDWRLVNDSDHSVLIRRQRAELAGSHSESLLRYHRPMLEDGVISYEFFYRSGGVAVHPALDRLCMILRPEGVGVHWLTDGKFDRTGLDPANITAVSNEEAPLRSDDWNAVQLTLRGDTVDLHLNGELIFTRELAPTNQRTFGLFHYADKTEARVRKLRWRGEWPRELSPPPQQQLADNRLEQLLGDAERLPVVLEHNFTQGLPMDRFYVIGGGWENHVEQLSCGLRMKRPGGNYARFGIAPQVTLSGDFDITVAFDDLRTSVVEGGEGNIQLLTVLDDERRIECRVYRKHYVFSGGRSEQLAQAAVFQRRGDETEYNFPASPAEESTSGRMRLARRGSQLYFLYAEDDSREFRLIHSQEVGTAPTRTAGVRLVLESHKEGDLAEVLWQSLVIRAESAAGPITSPALSVAQLDEERRQLSAKTRIDFSAGASEAAIGYWGDLQSFSRDQQGMKIEARGADQWTAAGVVSQLGLEGDFDVALDLEVLHLEKPKENSESTVYLQAGFDDAAQTAVEVKYSISPNGIRDMEFQLNAKIPDGSISYQELSTRQTDGVRQLRLARRGGIVYLIYQPASAALPQILGRAEVGRAPVPATHLRALVHTGGAGRKTVVRFRDLRVHAERIIGPAALLEGK